MADLSRAFSWNEEDQPVMVIYKKQPMTQTVGPIKKKIEGYVIELNDVFMYSRDHYPATVPCFWGYDSRGAPIVGYKTLTYDEAMFAKCSELCHQFSLGLVTSQKMAEIASLIEEGIGDLLAMSPRKELKNPVVGEMKITIKGSGGGKVEKTVDIT